MAGAMLVAGVGLCLAVLIAVFGNSSSSGGTKEQKEALERAQSMPDPFADLERTPAPTVKAREGSGESSAPRFYNTSPDDLLEAGEWLRGTAHAQKAITFDAEAAAAKKAGDTATYVSRGVKARAAYDAALTEVRDWELKIRDQHGDGDRKVRKVIKEITAWSKGWRRYRKLATSG